MNNELFSRLKDLAKKENRARLAVLLGAAAMLLILLSELFTPSEKTAAASAAPAVWASSKAARSGRRGLMGIGSSRVTAC